MREELRKRIIAYNLEKATNKEAADDLHTLLNALPPGQAKNLLKDDVCGPILEKHGIEEE